MTAIRTAALVLAIAVSTVWPLAAQQPAIRMSLPEVGAFEVMGVEAVDFGPPTKGAPYTAQATTEVMQQLADGNRIERRSSSTIARDSQGRVRREQQVAAIGPLVTKNAGTIVIISDPVAGVSYTLNETRRTAMRMPAGTFEAGTVRGRVGSAGTRVTMSGVGHVGVGVGVGTGVIATAPVQSAAFDAHSTTQQLPARQIEGLTAEGTRTTMTIAAGQIGNVQPIEVVSERWFSKELNAVVLSRTTDPRFGETVYRLENIVRGEPSPELFQVPADYQIQGLPK